LKNPALAHRDAIQVLLDEEVSWNTDQLKNYYQKMLKSADSQVNLIYNLLHWAQVQSGYIFYQPILFDLAAELRRNDFLFLRNQASYKGVEFIIEMPETALVLGDANIINTIVRNLLDNAVKFTSSGGKVTLSVTQAENGKFIISVADTGIGMTEEQVLSLFQFDCPTSKRGTAGEQGTGLGLIVCKKLLAKHEITLLVESKINGGSRFYFEV
jgi:signal transduction histidine kinase